MIAKAKLRWRKPIACLPEAEDVEYWQMLNIGPKGEEAPDGLLILEHGTMVVKKPYVVDPAKHRKVRVYGEPRVEYVSAIYRHEEGIQLANCL